MIYNNNNKNIARCNVFILASWALSRQAGVENYGLNQSTSFFANFCVLLLQSEWYRIIFYKFFPRFHWTTFFFLLSIPISTTSRIYDVMTRYVVQSTCSNGHLYKATARLRRPMLSPPKQIPIQSLLYKTTTCLTRPATTFFVSQIKKNLFKITTTKLYPAKKWEVNTRQHF